jgi:hypothetical protein
MPTPPPPTTPRQIDSIEALDLTLLDSSPPDGTELREANEVINSVVRESNLRTPARRYIKRAVHALEKTQSEIVLLRRENTEQRELLQQRKERKRGKRVALKGKFVFNTQEILDAVEKAEAEASMSKSKNIRATGRTTPEIEDDVEEVPRDIPSGSESDCIIVAVRR